MYSERFYFKSNYYYFKNKESVLNTKGHEQITRRYKDIFC